MTTSTQDFLAAAAELIEEAAQLRADIARK